MIWPFGKNPGRDRAREHYRRGLDFLDRRDPAAALVELQKAAQLEPGNADYWRGCGNAEKALGHLERAIGHYQLAVRCAPDATPAWYNLGLTLVEAGRPREAEPCFRRVVERDPRDGDAHFHLAALLHSSGRIEDAARHYRLALESAPENAYLWLCLGKCCAETPRQDEEAVACFLRSIELDPALAEARLQLGVTLKRLGRTAQAVAAFREALDLDPGNGAAHNDLGNLLQDEGRLDEAETHYRTAVRRMPDDALASNNLGCLLLRRNRLEEAAACFERAIELQPELAGAHLNLGQIHGLRNERDRALACYETAVRLRPEDAAARECLLFELQNVCDWSRFDELCALQRRAVVEQPEQPVSPFSLLCIPSTPGEQLRCARNFAARLLRATGDERARLNFRFDRAPRNRLRIGYLSADFHEHATAYLAAELFELHDRSRFEVIAYSYGPDDGSPMRRRLSRAFDRFVDLAGLSHAGAAQAIHADAVDILVDLKGYTQHARTEIMALRPAPVQASYLGYPGTMGAGFIDYLIADRVVIAPGSEEAYSERIVFLPGSYQVNDRKRPLAQTPSRAACGLPEEAVVFCCFNQSYKILPETFATWMRLLRAVPRSVLWLLEANPWAVRNLRREARARGVDPARLIFAPRLPLDRHLARLPLADLVLDTRPYNAHTTASDALWTGVPVVTCPGDTFASRVAASLLVAAGLPELVAATLEDYEALAVRLARAPEERAALRRHLTESRCSMPLFDTPAFTRHLERAYEEMWRKHLAGTKPRPPD